MCRDAFWFLLGRTRNGSSSHQVRLHHHKPPAPGLGEPAQYNQHGTRCGCPVWVWVCAQRSANGICSGCGAQFLGDDLYWRMSCVVGNLISEGPEECILMLPSSELDSLFLYNLF